MNGSFKGKCKASGRAASDKSQSIELVNVWEEQCEQGRWTRPIQWPLRVGAGCHRYGFSAWYDAVPWSFGVPVPFKYLNESHTVWHLWWTDFCFTKIKLKKIKSSSVENYAYSKLGASALDLIQQFSPRPNQQIRKLSAVQASLLKSGSLATKWKSDLFLFQWHTLSSFALWSVHHKHDKNYLLLCLLILTEKHDGDTSAEESVPECGHSAFARSFQAEFL